MKETLLFTKETVSARQTCSTDRDCEGLKRYERQEKMVGLLKWLLVQRILTLNHMDRAQ